MRYRVAGGSRRRLGSHWELLEELLERACAGASKASLCRKAVILISEEEGCKVFEGRVGGIATSDGAVIVQGSGGTGVLRSLEDGGAIQA